MATRPSHLDPFEAAVLATVRERCLFGVEARVLVALSGGADSVALLASLAALRQAGALAALSACHVNHQLRAGSDADGEACAALCAMLEVSLVRVPVTVPGGENVQQAARRERYRALRQAALFAGASRVATGHNRGNQAETVLLRLLRGAGARGLSGIPPRRGVLVRPLLDLTRADIVAYLGRRGLAWREDPTNATPRYARNRVRAEVMPLLEALAPGARGAWHERRTSCGTTSAPSNAPRPGSRPVARPRWRRRGSPEPRPRWHAASSGGSGAPRAGAGEGSRRSTSAPCSAWCVSDARVRSLCLADAPPGEQETRSRSARPRAHGVSRGSPGGAGRGCAEEPASRQSSVRPASARPACYNAGAVSDAGGPGRVRRLRRLSGPASNWKGKRALRQSYKTVLLWVVLILMFVAFYQFFAQHDRKQKELAFSDFISKVEKGDVREVQVKDNVNYMGVLKDGSEFHTVGPIDPMASIFTKLSGQGVKVVYDKPEGNSFWVTVLVQYLPLVFLFLFFFFFMRQLQCGGGKAMTFGKSKAKLLTESHNKSPSPTSPASTSARRSSRRSSPSSRTPRSSPSSAAASPRAC